MTLGGAGRGLAAIGKTAALLAVSTAAAQLIQFAVTPILTRLFTPADFGYFGAFVAVASTLTVVSSLRYELSIPIEKNGVRAAELVELSIFVNLGFSIIVAILVVLAVLALPGKIAWTSAILLPTFLVVVGAYRIFSMLAIRKHKFLLVGQTKIVQALTGAMSQVGSGLLAAGSFGLIIGFVLGQSLGVGRLVRTLGSPLSTPTRRSISRKLVLAKTYRRFPLLDSPAALADTAGAQLPAALLLLIFGPAVAGFYLLAIRLVAAPAALVSQALGQSMLGSVSEYVSAGKAPRLMLRVAAILSLVALGGCALAFPSVETVTVWLFGESWREAGQYAKWVALAVGAQFVYSPISFVLLAAEGQKVNLQIHILLLLLKALVLVRGYIGGQAINTVIELSVVNAVGYLAATVWAFLHVRRYTLDSGVGI